MGTLESLWKNETERYFFALGLFQVHSYLPGSSEQRSISTKSETSSLFCGNEIKHSMRPLKSYSKINSTEEKKALKRHRPSLFYNTVACFVFLLKISIENFYFLLCKNLNVWFLFRSQKPGKTTLNTGIEFTAPLAMTCLSQTSNVALKLLHLLVLLSTSCLKPCTRPHTP